MKRILALALCMLLVFGMAATAEDTKAEVAIEVGSRGEKVEQLQQKLNELGYSCGMADGIFGPRTEAALTELQTALGWEATGSILVDQLEEVLSLTPEDVTAATVEGEKLLGVKENAIEESVEKQVDAEESSDEPSGESVEDAERIKGSDDVNAEEPSKLEEPIADKLDESASVQTGDGVNLAYNTSDEWSDWMTPVYGEKNQTFYVSYVELGEKNVGDTYTCQIEVEFKSVTLAENESFLFQTQGTTDGEWVNKENIWSPRLIRLTEIPEDGVYQYKYTSTISEKNVDSSLFRIGFRCDYWASGSFRVRCIKVEKGGIATAWSEGPVEVESAD